MKIFNVPPEDWKDLQNKCAKILSDAGFEVEVEKDISTTRGEVNIDVFAVNKQSYSNEIILTECKYWESAIPKTVTHAFRTVVGDYGANSGFIIAKSGFQKGVYDAVKNTNVFLLNFDEFQENFRMKYLSNIILKLEKVSYALRKYADPGSSSFDLQISKLTKEKNEKRIELCFKYNGVSLYSRRFNYSNSLTGEIDIDYIDYFINKEGKSILKTNAVDCYSDYFDGLLRICEQGLEKFDALFGEKLRVAD